jgi:hypothetical protein
MLELRVGAVPSAQGLPAVSPLLVLASWQAKAQPPVASLVVRVCIWVMPAWVAGSDIEGELSRRT